jgi:hypothetical protein
MRMVEKEREEERQVVSPSLSHGHSVSCQRVDVLVRDRLDDGINVLRLA